MLVRNIVFTSICAIISFACIIAIGIAQLSPNRDEPRVIELEQRNATTADDVLSRSFLDGKAQPLAERFIADHVPFRTELVLFAAGYQRPAIMIAALAAGFPAYPTYFGSETQVLSDSDHLMPKYQQTTSREYHESFFESIRQSAMSHPECNYYLEFLVHPDQSNLNPTFNLVSTDEEPVVPWMQGFLDEIDSGNVKSTIYQPESTESLLDLGFKTDPHFKMDGALRVYNVLADLANLTHFDIDSLEPLPIKDSWNGQYAREGRDTEIEDPFYDYKIDFSNLTYYSIDDTEHLTPIDCGMRRKVITGEMTPEDVPVFGTYLEYFGDDDCVAINSGANNGKTVLLVADSFAFPLRDYIASNYEKSVIIFPGNNKCKKSLDKLIEEYDADDVVFLMHSLKVSVIANRSPKFLDLTEE